ncbi:hypothetical protein DMUE_1069 [Dictyocoela muelleri]|nr:hypothetical protein DMUE_1069 [Dictyocoela muelleri]
MKLKYKLKLKKNTICCIVWTIYFIIAIFMIILLTKYLTPLIFPSVIPKTDNKSITNATASTMTNYTTFYDPGEIDECIDLSKNIVRKINNYMFKNKQIYDSIPNSVENYKKICPYLRKSRNLLKAIYELVKDTPYFCKMNGILRRIIYKFNSHSPPVQIYIVEKYPYNVEFDYCCEENGDDGLLDCEKYLDY